MDISIFLIICGLALFGSLSLVSNQICEEGSHSSKNEQRRSLESVYDDLVDNPICDEGLAEDEWFRFYSSSGNKIVERAANNPVPEYHCGTEAPIYIRGLDSHPVTDYAQKSATVCANYGDDPCKWMETIEIFRCPATRNSSYYYLYKLKSPPGCSMAYCVGDSVACNRGDRWDGTSCVKLFPAMRGFPKFSGPHLNGTGLDEEIYFKCEVQYDRQPNDANARFRVTFLFDGKPLEYVDNKTDLPPTDLNVESDSELTAILTELHLRGRLGREISCQAESYWVGGSQNISTMSSVVKYHAAFESTVQSYNINLINGPTHAVTFRSTLPFTCSRCCNKRGSCCERYRFRLRNSTAASPDCFLYFKKGNDTAVLTVYFVPVVMSITHSYALVFEAYNDDHVSANGLSLWRDYVIPPVLLTVVPEPKPYMQCISVGDPHLRTFDDATFDNYMVGDFYLVKAINLKQHMEIQVRHELCNGQVTCNCGVIVREGNSAFKISVCEGGTWWSLNKRSPTVIRLLSQKPADASTVLIDQTGLSYSIRMPSGLRVEVDTNPTWFNIEVHLPPEYHGKTDSASMCGNGNQNTNDDSQNPQNFRIPDHLSYFRHQPACSLIYNAAATRCGCNGTYPICSNNDTRLDVVSKSNEQYLGRASTGNICLNGTKRSRRDETEMSQYDSNNDENDFIFDYDTAFPPYTYDPNFGVNASFTWPTPKGKTEHEVEQYCSDMLQSSPAYADCSSNADLTSIIAMCASDIQIADDWISVSAYTSIFEQDCINNIVGSINSSEASNPTATLEVLTLVSGKVCPNQCSGQGTCSAGTCTCNSGYMGADCSIDQTLPPSLTGIIRGGLCDVLTRPCDVISVFGTGVAFSSMVKCRFTDQNTGSYAETEGKFITALEYSCPVPETTTHRRRRSVTARTTALSTRTVAITVNSVIYSNTLDLVLFNSVCMECNTSQACRQTNNSCLVDGECFASGTANPDNYCLQCVPSVSRNSLIDVTVVEDWSSCTRNCDIGIATKNTVCGYRVKNKEFRFCKVLDCPGNAEQKTQGFGITLSLENLTKILSEQGKFFNVITESLNSYCSTHAVKCCQSIGVSSTSATSITYTSPNLTSYASGYPMITASDTKMKVIVKIDEERLRADCSGTERLSSRIVYADTKLIYDAVSGAKTNIERELEVAIESVWSPDPPTLEPVTQSTQESAISEPVTPESFTQKRESVTKKSMTPQHITSEHKTPEPVTQQTFTPKPATQKSVSSGSSNQKPVTTVSEQRASTASATSSLLFPTLGMHLLLKGF